MEDASVVTINTKARSRRRSRSNVLLQEAKQLFINQLKIKLNSAASLLWHVQSGLCFSRTAIIIIIIMISIQWKNTILFISTYSTHHLQSVLKPSSDDQTIGTTDETISRSSAKRLLFKIPFHSSLKLKSLDLSCWFRSSLYEFFFISVSSSAIATTCGWFAALCCDGQNWTRVWSCVYFAFFVLSLAQSKEKPMIQRNSGLAEARWSRNAATSSHGYIFAPHILIGSLTSLYHYL